MKDRFPYREAALRQVSITPLQVQQQIAKDFAKCLFTFPDSFRETPAAPDEIRARLSEKISEVLQSGERELLQLLYVIDIPEQHFMAALSDKDLTGHLTELILQREAYKVYLRHHFRTK